MSILMEGMRELSKAIKSNKTSNLNVRIEPEIKNSAEDILNDLGLSASAAVNIFYRQIIENQGLPFEIKKASVKPLNINALSKFELDEELEKGYADIEAGRTQPAKEVFEELRKDYGV